MKYSSLESSQQDESNGSKIVFLGLIFGVILNLTLHVTKSFKRFTSNILNNGYFARYNTKVEDVFFNRKRELLDFSNAFNDKPQLHVVLGPPSTGKPHWSVRILGSEFTVGYEGFEAGFKLADSKEITSVDVRNLLKDIKNCLPQWTIWRRYDKPPPILIIDEANMFNQLGDLDPALLKSILNWMVLNTKQERRFNIVLTSSDSFFLNWIVTHLSKEEAEEYFEKHVLPQYECKELEGKFDHVCGITGSRMMMIDMYVKEYKNKKGMLEDDEFSIFRLEDDKLSSGLDPARIPVNKIGREKVISLITYNILHRRPINNFANDIINPPRKVILTAMNKPSIRAMERLLHEISSNKK
ncbi:hypothetical protein C1646_753989 [Rhizophagus diaphanus]|nr:hypothetical protein C1646_753989 [Rhizophagus diaphanus] [Rhizophagus sp. MUCL 43196]